MDGELRCRTPLPSVGMRHQGLEDTGPHTVALSRSASSGWPAWGTPDMQGPLLSKNPVLAANSPTQAHVFQDLNATSEPRGPVAPDGSPFGLCNAFSPFLAIWLWAQRFDCKSRYCFQSLQCRLYWKPLPKSTAAQMVSRGELVFP